MNDSPERPSESSSLYATQSESNASCTRPPTELTRFVGRDDHLRELHESDPERTPVHPDLDAAEGVVPAGALLLDPSHLELACETPVVDLVVSALGPLRIHLNGEPVPNSAWPFAKPRELLLFLLVHGRAASRDEISRALWPKSSAARLKNCFHVALHHLRKALGDPAWIVIEDGRYRLSRNRSISFDVDEFEQICARALGADPAIDDEVGSELLFRRALQLFRGDFATDQPTARWHDGIVDRTRALRVRVGLKFGERLERENRRDEAADIYRDLVAQDELHEEVHRRFMSVLAGSGHRTEALRHYKRFRELLARELDAEPEGETRLLWDRIRTGPLEMHISQVSPL